MDNELLVAVILPVLAALSIIVLIAVVSALPMLDEPVRISIVKWSVYKRTLLRGLLFKIFFKPGDIIYFEHSIVLQILNSFQDDVIYNVIESSGQLISDFILNVINRPLKWNRQDNEAAVSTGEYYIKDKINEFKNKAWNILCARQEALCKKK